MRVLIDTGSTHSFIRSSILGLTKHGPIEKHRIDLVLADGFTPFPILDEVSLMFRIKSISTASKAFVVKDLCCDCPVGLDWLRENAFTLDVRQQRLIVRNRDLHATIHLKTDIESIPFPVRVSTKTIIPPIRQVVVKAHIQISFSRRAIFTPRPHLEYNNSIDLPSAVLNIHHYTTHLTISNCTNRPCVLAKNTRLRNAVQMESSSILASITRSMKLPPTKNNPPNGSPDSLTSIIDDFIKHISASSEDYTNLKRILIKHSSILDTTTTRIADTTSVHTIRTDDTHPQNSRAYPQNSEQRLGMQRCRSGLGFSSTVNRSKTITH
jgi:hypothetical protein